jgi:hypothetical protein
VVLPELVEFVGGFDERRGELAGGLGELARWTVDQVVWLKRAVQGAEIPASQSPRDYHPTFVVGAVVMPPVDPMSRCRTVTAVSMWSLADWRNVIIWLSSSMS